MPIVFTGNNLTLNFAEELESDDSAFEEEGGEEDTKHDHHVSDESDESDPEPSEVQFIKKLEDAIDGQVMRDADGGALHEEDARQQDTVVRFEAIFHDKLDCDLGCDPDWYV